MGTVPCTLSWRILNQMGTVPCRTWLLIDRVLFGAWTIKNNLVCPCRKVCSKRGMFMHCLVHITLYLYIHCVHELLSVYRTQWAVNSVFRGSVCHHDAVLLYCSCVLPSDHHMKWNYQSVRTVEHLRPVTQGKGANFQVSSISQNVWDCHPGKMSVLRLKYAVWSVVIQRNLTPPTSQHTARKEDKSIKWCNPGGWFYCLIM